LPVATANFALNVGEPPIKISPGQIQFKEIPVPPTVNSAYRNVPGRGRVASKAYSSWRRAFNYWAMNLGTNIDTAKAVVQTKIAAGAPLSISLVFVLGKMSLLCRDGRTKKWDVSNRIKLIEDALCGLLEIDDCEVWTIVAGKRVCENWEGVNATISWDLPTPLAGGEYHAVRGS
jgi:Holliday junction resolvase RusA-like endonuclease